MKSWMGRWSPAILMMTAIFLASGTPGQDLPRFGNWDYFAKKGGHMLGYALLASAYLRALSPGTGVSRNRLPISLILAALYAFSDEWHQRFVPGRTASIYDVLIDTAGATIGLAVFYFVSFRLQVSRSKPASSVESDSTGIEET